MHGWARFPNRWIWIALLRLGWHPCWLMGDEGRRPFRWQQEEEEETRGRKELEWKCAGPVLGRSTVHQRHPRPTDCVRVLGGSFWRACLDDVVKVLYRHTDATCSVCCRRALKAAWATRRRAKFASHSAKQQGELGTRN